MSLLESYWKNKLDVKILAKCLSMVCHTFKVYILYYLLQYDWILILRTFVYPSIDLEAFHSNYIALFTQSRISLGAFSFCYLSRSPDEPIRDQSFITSTNCEIPPDAIGTCPDFTHPEFPLRSFKLETSGESNRITSN